MSNDYDFTFMNFGERVPEMEGGDRARGVDIAITELMRAMILRAIEDYQSGSANKESAFEYITSEEDEYVFSFRAICKHFGFDPDKTRDRIIGADDRIRTRRRAAA